MGTPTLLKSYVTDNPIQQAESLMLLRGRNGWWGKWLWRLAIGLVVFLLILPFINGGNTWFRHDLNVTISLLVLIQVVLYAKIMMATLATGAQSVVRERTGRTLDLLLLTGINHRQFVLGKWLGVMRSVLRDHAWLWILRVGTLVWYSAYWQVNLNTPWNQYDEVRLSGVIVNWDAVLLAAVILLGFGFLEMALSSAVGILTGLFPWAKRAGVWVAAVLRLGVPVMIAGIVAWSMGQFEPWPFRPELSHEVRTQTITSIGSLFDSGALSSIYYIHNGQWDDVYAPDSSVLSGQLIGMALYVGLTGISLGLATTVAVRQGINNSSGHQVVRKRKIDRITALNPVKSAVLASEPAITPILDEGATNIFDLADADKVRVELYQYRRNVSQLHLRLMSDAGVQYAQFSGVAYMDVPSRWIGADFRVGTADELQAALQENGIHLNSLMSEGVRLFIAQAGDKTVRIIAARAQRLSELPNRG
ncbi:MAG: hypothetical protein H6670_00635 [Anaerolineaceae bacterium]|nr:hypothetical protein [Anaerolineaceae bacterium]